MSGRSESLEVVLFKKIDCHLCELVEAEIRSTQAAFDLTAVDINTNREAHDKYWMKIPVVTIGGREVFEAKMMDRHGEWKRRLRSLLGEP